MGSGEEFPERLRRLRKQRALSQTELGDLVGVHYNHIGRCERGASRPSADTAGRLARALGVSCDCLLSGRTGDDARGRLKDPELLRLFREIEVLPEVDKHVVRTLLDAFSIRNRVRQERAEGPA